MKPQRIIADWHTPIIVAATGPSLTSDVAWKCRQARWFRGWRIVVVNDAWQLMRCADVLYACDAKWWEIHYPAISDPKTGFHGELWTSHEPGQVNDKSKLPFKLNAVGGKAASTFSTDPALVHYGSNSGFQAVNFALLKSAAKQRIVLVGFDMKVVGGKRHFFGDHPAPLHNRANYDDFIRPFRTAAKHCRAQIVNATPGSALDCFPKVELDVALADDAAWKDHLLHRHGAVTDSGAG